MATIMTGIDSISVSDWDNLAKLGLVTTTRVAPPKQEQVVQRPEKFSNTQVGGSHYQLPIQPVDYCLANDMDFLQANVIKYVTRHKNKGKEQDIRKAIHYCRLILEKQYGNK